MLDADVDPEFVQRQIPVATRGALLATAATVGLRASMGPLDAQEWRDAAAVQPE
jgi:hypothetical protein